MAPPLSPHDVLERDPAVRLVPLAGGGVLADHPRHPRILRGSRLEDLERLLALVDGTRTAGEIVELLAGEFEEEGVVRTLRSLLGVAVDKKLRAPQLTASEPPQQPRLSVGIVGGGTAGHLAALALARRGDLRVTLIESSAVPVIGVGEATTPLLPQFLHADLDLPIHDLFAHVRPTLKLGIRFDWGRPGFAFNYPFGPSRLLEPAVYDGDPEAASLRSLAMSTGKVPARPGTAVAYHLDNRRFVGWLAEHARRAGVERIDATIADVEVDGAGEDRRVTALTAEDGRRFSFDLYVDASGFRSLLLGRALGSPFVPFAPSLPTDRAVVGTAPLPGEVPPYTRAETYPAGWCWSTPQRDEDHRGYVFCSAFETPEGAEAELRSRVPGLGEPRLVAFEAGRREHFILGNVAALGNAYGFVEPLESTALHLLVRQIGLLVRFLPWRPEERGRLALLNRKVAGFWDYLRWFLALHFRFNRRLDTPFWRACRERVDVSAWGELIDAYRERGPLSAQPTLPALFDAPDPLWGLPGIDLLLLGQGVPCAPPAPAESEGDYRRRVAAARAAVEAMPTHAELLETFDREPERLEELAAAFREVGPAFG